MSDSFVHVSASGTPRPGAGPVYGHLDEAFAAAVADAPCTILLGKGEHQTEGLALSSASSTFGIQVVGDSMEGTTIRHVGSGDMVDIAASGVSFRDLSLIAGAGTTNMVHIDGSGAMSPQYNRFENVWLRGGGISGIAGLFLDAATTFVGYNYFRNLKITNTSKGVRLIGGTQQPNANVFDALWVDVWSSMGVEINKAFGNVFNGGRIENGTGTYAFDITAGAKTVVLGTWLENFSATGPARFVAEVSANDQEAIFFWPANMGGGTVSGVNNWGRGSCVRNTNVASDYIYMKGGQQLLAPATSTTIPTFMVKAGAANTGNLLEVEATNAAIGFRVNYNQYPIVAKNSAPADADLAANECAWWFDATNGAAKAMFKGKTANGTVVTGSLPLT